MTQADEDRAHGRIKATLRGPDPPRLATSAARPPGSTHALGGRPVGVRGAFGVGVCGVSGRPDPAGPAGGPESWTRERWNPALAELNGA